MNTPEKLKAKIRKDKSGCWIWQGHIDQKGYGQTSYRGKHDRAHRVFYIMFKGEIPKGKELDHLCRKPACVNPDHLEAVTHRINQLRGSSWVSKNYRKTHCPKKHEYTKENTYMNPSGSRVCRICRDMNFKNYKNRAKRLVVRT